MGGVARERNSLETILTFENRDAQSDWSVVWSTAHIPGMDPGTGGGAWRRSAGRRRLRLGSLALGAFLTMHCRVTASALTGGFFVFMIILIVAVVLLANPLRHFEVYLGQWSISGPGRAFRIIPMFDGIGIAICINAIVRAICCCTMAAISVVYVVHSIADAKLPFTYCRDFALKAYEPKVIEVKSLMLQESRFMMETGILDDEDIFPTSTVGFGDQAWRNASYMLHGNTRIERKAPKASFKIEICNETYPGTYPSLYSTPAYNFFYVEVVHFRSDYNFGHFNTWLVLSLISTWLVIWVLMVMERILHGRLIWNNMYSWFVFIPWIWAIILIIAAINSVIVQRSWRRVFRIGTREILSAIADALEVAIYIHSASVGTELIHGKGLNHYAAGHIDHRLHGENVWHSALLLLLTTLHCGGSAVCAVVDYIQPDVQKVFFMQEGTLWIIPMYSKCTSYGSHSHLISTIIFGGLVISYITVAFVLLKTALHTIFEYKVKLVFIEQFVVGSLILTCMGCSLLFATNGGIALLDSVDAMMSGVAMPLVCLLELIGLMYVYRSNDFMSDLNLATEENACGSRIDTLWRIIPIITLGTLIITIVVLTRAEMPTHVMWYSLSPLMAVVVAVPMRACHNAYVFLKPAPRRGT